MQQAIARLEEAFGGLPVPADDEIVYDNRPQHLECAQIRKRLSGRRWEDLSPEEVAYDSSALYFLSAKAFRFYLPAWAKLSLIAWDEVDLAPTALLVALETPELEDLRATHRERMTLLSKPQKRALAVVVQLLRELHPLEVSPREVKAALSGMKEGEAVRGSSDRNRRQGP